MTRAKVTEPWREQWKRKHNWTASELAKLCCGWNPSVDVLPDPTLYNQTLDAITRAVRAKALRTLDLLWPPVGGERLYADMPLFTPRVAAAWAAQEYAGTFIYASDSSDGWWHEGPPETGGGASVKESIVAPTDVASSSANVFRRGSDGRWEIRYGGDREIGLSDLKGFELIRRLLETPNEFVEATVLMGISPADASYGSPIIDEKAGHNFKMRLREIGEERKEAEAVNDSARQLELDEEAERIGIELRASTGLHGPRRLGDEVEKARKAALQNYRTALKKLAQLPALYEHLSTTVQTGQSFGYRPNADVRWDTRT